MLNKKILIAGVFIAVFAIAIALYGAKPSRAQVSNLVITVDPNELPVVGNGNTNIVIVKNDPAKDISIPANTSYFEIIVDGQALNGQKFVKYDTGSTETPWPTNIKMGTSTFSKAQTYELVGAFFDENNNKIDQITNSITVRSNQSPVITNLPVGSASSPVKTTSSADTFVGAPSYGSTHTFDPSVDPYLVLPSAVLNDGEKFNVTFKNIPASLTTQSYTLSASSDYQGNGSHVVGSFDDIKPGEKERSIVVDPTDPMSKNFLYGIGDYYFYVSNNSGAVSMPQVASFRRAAYPVVQLPGCAYSGNSFIALVNGLLPADVGKKIDVMARLQDDYVATNAGSYTVRSGDTNVMITAKINDVGTYLIRVSSVDPPWSSTETGLVVYAPPVDQNTCNPANRVQVGVGGLSSYGTTGTLPGATGTAGSLPGATGTTGTLPSGSTPIGADIGTSGELPTPGLQGEQAKAVQTGQSPGSPVAAADFSAYLADLYNWVSIIISVLAILMMIYGGYLYMTSGGNQEITKKAKDVIIGAISGIVIVGLTYLFFQTVNPDVFKGMPSLNSLAQKSQQAQTSIGKGTSTNTNQNTNKSTSPETPAPTVSPTVYGPPNNPSLGTVVK